MISSGDGRISYARVVALAFDYKRYRLAWTGCSDHSVWFDSRIDHLRLHLSSASCDVQGLKTRTVVTAETSWCPKGRDLAGRSTHMYRYRPVPMHYNLWDSANSRFSMKMSITNKCKPTSEWGCRTVQQHDAPTTMITIVDSVEGHQCCSFLRTKRRIPEPNFTV